MTNKEQEVDRLNEAVAEIVAEWRERADAMEKHIESPTETERFIIGFVRARANELEARVLSNNE